MTAASPFPEGFVWGAATSAYQIEGAAGEDGRGESVWDRFCATPGKVRNGDTGAVACDFYHRYGEDVGLAAELGLDAFRFSIAWPRVLPEGRGRVNPAGLDFYDRLVDELLARGLEPFPTLFHWDTPQALENEGGWSSRATVGAFAEYADAVVARLGDRVRRWTTHNEPWVAAWLGHAWGLHAPGRTSEADAVAVAHHLLLSHARVAEAIRVAAPEAEVGIVLNLAHVDAASDADEDVAAARALDGGLNRWFLDPLFRGSYPADLVERNALAARVVRAGDLESIAAAPLDFLGVNTYSRFVVAAGEGGQPRLVRPPGEYTAMDWEVYPDGLRRILVRVAGEYGPPALLVTENGSAFADVRGHDGRVRDPERAAYLERHVEAVGRAIEAGAPVEGYFVWSLLDNFEWAEGYAKRFGLVYVDYPTLARVPKDSFHRYRDLIRAHRPVPVPAPSG